MFVVQYPGTSICCENYDRLIETTNNKPDWLRIYETQNGQIIQEIFWKHKLPPNPGKVES